MRRSKIRQGRGAARPRTVPYGAWKSPITTDLIVAGAVGFTQIAADGADIYWGELRPTEGGRIAIVRRRGERAENVLCAPYNARTRVHEYGGGAFAVAGGVIYFSNFADQRVHRLTPGGAPQPITPEGDWRYADGVVDRGRLIVVREDHGVLREPRNELVALDLEGRREALVLATGRDFYSSPRLSPDGKLLAWLCWDHPNMPWDGTELWLAEIRDDGTLGSAERVAGGAEESVFQPEFAPDGALYFVSDRDGWWNLYRRRRGRDESLAPMAAEFGAPQWAFGMSTYAFVSDATLACAFNGNGTWRLALLDLASGRLEPVKTPYTEISSVTAAAGAVVFIGGSVSQAPAVARYSPATHRCKVLRRSVSEAVHPGYLSRPEAVDYASAGGAPAHAFYYPPRNRDFRAPAGEKPPLLVLSHGGPTAAASSALNLKVQYWASRGFAVLDVNYRGSTGYGREYRRRLNGRWGVADVEDCAHGARRLIERGLVDPRRVAIRGGSAGGYTALCALVFQRVFRAGAVYYGVSDLERLAHDTHKFEAHYLDRLIGPYPAARALYRERSPLHHADRICCPVIFFQGLEDRVVPPDQTELMVAALRAKGVPVAYVPFADEQHGIRHAENIKAALESELFFYARIFGLTPADPIRPLAIENLS